MFSKLNVKNLLNSGVSGFMLRSRRRLLRGVALVALAAWSGGALALDDPSKGLTVLASHAPGGGYDAYARLYARHVAKHIPGLTSVTVRNMPGAAGVVMANHMGAQAPQDGSTIALGPGSVATAPLFKRKGARYDAQTFGWIGSLNSDVSVAVSRSDTSIRAIEDAYTTELVVGGAGASDNSVVYANILNKMMGAQLKLVAGYNGSGETVLALERGEVQGIAGWNYSSITSMRPDWLKEGRIRILVQMSLERHAELPDVRTILEIAKDDEQRETLKLIFTQSLIGRVLFAPPKLSAASLDVHRKAFDAVVKDTEFLADAAKARLEINGPLGGARVQKIVDGVYGAPPERIRQAAETLEAG